MSVCQFQCIQVFCRGVNKCVTNLDDLTTVADIINALLDDLIEKQYLSANDCCLYIEQQPYLFALKSTDYIQDILFRYSTSNIRFKLAFKRTSSPSRFAQRKQLLHSTIIDPYEQLRIQELLIKKQQEIINQLSKVNDGDNRVPNTRQSRQTVNNHEETSRSLSRVRFRLSTISRRREATPSLSIGEVKSILKKSSIQRSSSVDRDIDQLISLTPGENSFCTTDDDNLSEQSTTDSCLGSLSSVDSISLETLV